MANTALQTDGWQADDMDTQEVGKTDLIDALTRIAERTDARRHQTFSSADEMTERHNECERIVDEIELFFRRLRDSGACEHMMHSADMWLAASKDFLAEFAESNR